MKVLCIDNQDVSLSITVGKWYQVVITSLDKHESSGLKLKSYSIITDTGTRGRFSKRFFITVDEWREKKLEELGIV